MNTPCNPEDPEQYIRDLEHGVSQPPGAAPKSSGMNVGPPFGTSFIGQSGGAGFGGTFARFPGVARLANSPRRLVILLCGIAIAAAVGWFVVDHANHTTVDGNLVMLDSGANATIDCNNGSVKLDGDNNTYTITGHCRRLEIFGSANHVTVDSADIISAFGDDNVMIYHSGSPTINKTGNNNLISQRSNGR
jgi:hypothetical protein